MFKKQFNHHQLKFGFSGRLVCEKLSIKFHLLVCVLEIYYYASMLVFAFVLCSMLLIYIMKEFCDMALSQRFCFQALYMSMSNFRVNTMEI